MGDFQPMTASSGNVQPVATLGGRPSTEQLSGDGKLINALHTYRLTRAPECIDTSGRVLLNLVLGSMSLNNMVCV